ncbi:MAG: phenylalanine--tRNA ligase subunit beta [Anaerovoracaceae bacterium]|jgi:phenylalanyl-tRNA synthetase beta chain
MLIPVEWLKEYVDLDVDIDVLCEKMIMSGSNIEEVKSFGNEIEGVVIGRILSIEKHPDAEKLLICKVDAGGEEALQVVTGASNVFKEAFVPVVLAGGRMLDGKIIKKGKLRGVESQGMLCSAKELGYEDKVVPVSHRDGIWILEGDYQVGQDFVTAMGIKDQIIDFEITPNRPDCLSITGMAREAAATFGIGISYPRKDCINETGNIEDYISLEIKKPELCKRYVARVAKDIKIGPSPWWLQKRLMHGGMRPINNIVDITNYVMLEYGQPLHAFDITMLKDNKIIVDTAEEGQCFTTLDGVERKLDSSMLMIKDGERNVAIAGVMGGLNSEIGDETETILIESANFLGDSVRRTSKKLGLRTEASSRFEKGIDPNLAALAADRVCKLIEELGIGRIIKGAADCYPSPQKNSPIRIRPVRINKVLGTDISAENMAEILKDLEMRVEIIGDIIEVTPPTVRQDLSSEVDFVEEIARMYGYDNLPSTLSKGSSFSRIPSKRLFRDLARDSLVGLGYNEIQTYSFVSPKGLDNLGIPEERRERKAVKLINPLGEENSSMRTLLMHNILEVMERNFTRNIPEVKCFELGNTFFDETGEDGLPKEEESLVIGCYGSQESFFTLKGIVEELLNKMGIKTLSFDSEENESAFHPGRCGLIYGDGERIGIIGELHPNVLDIYEISGRVYCCEMNFDKIAKLANKTVLYKPLPKYPSTSRDIALLLDEEIPASKVAERIREKGDSILESVTLFDVYRGKQVPKGKKSIAFTLTYRKKDGTLTDEEVQPIHEEILKVLRDKLDAVLREI